MIAHRLQTIETADNLLYLENPESVLAGSKGTPEYDNIMERLRRTNYAHQVDDKAASAGKTQAESGNDDANQLLVNAS